MQFATITQLKVQAIFETRVEQRSKDKLRDILKREHSAPNFSSHFPTKFPADSPLSRSTYVLVTFAYKWEYSMRIHGYFD